MKLLVFTKRENCNVFNCLEALYQRKKLEFYVFDQFEQNLVNPLLASKEQILIVLDYESFPEEALNLVGIFKSQCPSLQIIITNAPQDMDKAMQFFACGVHYYLTSNLERSCLCKFLNELTETVQDSHISDIEPLQLYVGKSRAIQRIKELLPTIAETNCNVLITGETGTGKELLARIIHQLSPRRMGPFIILDCTTLQESIFESEVFGHEKGAFTGAVSCKKGLVELADGGTLFVDEIGELPLPLQKKFLRFIQEKTFLRVGGTKFLKADVRIIAATNRNLEKEVRKGNFRSDLYYRLNTLIIEIPPLRERKEDIPLLLEHFIKLKTKELGRTFKGFSRGFLEQLIKYDWPGNVRELINLVERAIILAKDGYLTEELLPNYILHPLESGLTPEATNSSLESEEKSTRLSEIEREIIFQALKKNNWNQTKTAEQLGLSRKQLINKMKKYGLFKEKDSFRLKNREN